MIAVTTRPYRTETRLPLRDREGLMRSIMRMYSRRCGIITVVLVTAICAGLPTPATAQVAPAAPDTAAVLAVVQRLFDAMAKRDTAAARALLLPGSRLVSLRTASLGAQPRQQTDTEFLGSLATGTGQLLERMWNPVASIHGSLANVWTPYDFHIDGRFSHCGVDNFVLVRSANAWQLASVTYTVETAGCVPSPLGAPR
jgi:hypothetical protein